MVRAPSSHGGGHRFESRVAHFTEVPQGRTFAGKWFGNHSPNTNPVRILTKQFDFGPVDACDAIWLIESDFIREDYARELSAFAPSSYFGWTGSSCSASRITNPTVPAFVT